MAIYGRESVERRSSVVLDTVTCVAVVAGILGLFLFDMSQPRGIVDGVGYAAIVALSVRLGERAVIASAALTTVLTIAAAFLVPDRGISIEGMWGNRGFAIVSIWIVAAILLRRLRLEAYIASRESELHNNQTALGTMIRDVLLSEKPLQLCIHDIGELAAETIRCDLCGIFQPNRTERRARTANVWDRKNKRHFVLHNIPINENPEYRRSIENDFVVAADDVLQSPAHRGRLNILRPLGIRAILIADTFSQQPGIGYIFFAFRTPHRWTRQEIAFARSVASLVALLFGGNQNIEMLAALDQVGEAIYVEDKFGVLQYANRAAKRLSPPTDDEHRKALPRPDNPLAGDSDMHEMRREDRDLEIQRLRLPNDGILTRINDVTSRNNAVAARMQYEASLQQSAKMEAIGDLAGGVAHDFNNILGSIMGFSGFLVQDLPERSAEHGFAERILSACERGKGLVEQILSFAQARAAVRDTVDLSLLLKRNREFLAGMLPVQIELKVAFPKTALPISGSAVQIGQLITNLCINARDALAEKPGTIRVTARLAAAREIETLKEPAKVPNERQFGDVQPERSYCLLEVEDNGSGMPPEILDRIFEPFFTTKGRHRGTGLGLAVVHGVILSTGGLCRVASIPGKDTTFSIYFPLARETADEPRRSQPLAVPRGNERILIVDDEPDIADMLAIGLERLGYETVGVNDPLEALAAFREDPGAFDVVVTDQVMPGLRGLDLIRRLREIRPQIKAILCTGYSASVTSEISHAAGADALFHKPVDATQIARQIRILVEQTP